MNVSVVIPNWNGAEYIKDCIDSLLSQSIKCNVVVVDNGSADNSDKVLATYGSKIVVLKQKKNLGFANGVNIGIKYVLENNSKYIALFNNDAVADKNWLRNLLAILDTDINVGIVTGKFLQFDKNYIDSTGDFMTIFGLSYPRGRNEIDKGQYDKKTDIFAGTGGASLYRAEMIKQIGLFDNDFFAYFEDVDISFRAQLAGWKVKFQPEALAYHRLSATASKISGFASYNTAKNFPLLYLKNMPGWLFIKYLPLAIYWYFRMFAARLIRGGFWSFAKGWLMSIYFTPKKNFERHQIQKARKVSVEYIDSILVHKRAPKPPQITKNK